MDRYESAPSPNSRQGGEGQRTEVPSMGRVSEEWNLSFSMMVESINDGVLVCDLEGNIDYVNPSLAHMLGYEPEEVVGRTVFDFMEKKWADRVAEKLERRRQGIEERYDHKMCHRDGSEVWGLVSAKPLRNDAGEPMGSLVAIQDITERKRMEEELVAAREDAEAASRAKSEFLANMSHEIRTPMNGILGMLELLDDGDLHKDQREYVQLARDAAEGLLQLIDDILDFSKIEARQLQLHNVEFSLADALGKTLHTLVQQAADKGLELVYHLERQIPPCICGDPARLRQVVINLVKNAIKFTEEGQISVTVEVEEKLDERVRLRFAVSDTGKGIGGEDRQKVFRAFHQEDTTPSRSEGGTGLGLTIARQLVELMDGDIWLDSAEGKGTTVCFTAEFGIVTDEQRRFRKRVEPLHELPVLVVDDNHVNRRFLNAVLTDWGMIPREATDGRQALRLLEQIEQRGDDIAVMLVDAELPGRSGPELVGEVHSMERWRDLPVVYLVSSGPGGEKHLSPPGDEAMEAQVISPVRPSSLMDAICDVLNLHEDQAEQPKPSEDETLSEGLTVLLAEDNPVNQRVTRGLLEKRNHRVILAENGREAVRRRFENEEIDVVLMDVQMPQVDGYEATHQIRQREEETGQRVPIIALTAHAMSGDREKVLQAGMDDYLPKPVAADDLYEAVEASVSRHESRASPP